MEAVTITTVIKPKLYWAAISAPSRFVFYFAVASGIDIDLVHVDLLKGQQRTPAFLAINPSGKVPALVDDGLNIFESAAIIRYLALKYQSVLYPLSFGAKINVLIDQVYELLRSVLMNPIVTLVANKAFSINPDCLATKKAEEELSLAFSNLSTQFFKESPHFVVGHRLTLADIFLGAYLSHLDVIDYEFSCFPSIVVYWHHHKKQEAFIQTHAQFYHLINVLFSRLRSRGEMGE